MQSSAIRGKVGNMAPEGAATAPSAMYAAAELGNFHTGAFRTVHILNNILARLFIFTPWRRNCFWR